VLFVHPICVHTTADKEASMRASGFWFMDSEYGEPLTRNRQKVVLLPEGHPSVIASRVGNRGHCCIHLLLLCPRMRVLHALVMTAGCAAQPGSASSVPACRPLQWRLPATEAPHFACPQARTLGLVHGGEPPAAAALRQASLSDEEADRLMNDPYHPSIAAMWCMSDTS
jgi:hypothetical protein